MNFTEDLTDNLSDEEVSDVEVEVKDKPSLLSRITGLFRREKSSEVEEGEEMDPVAEEVEVVEAEEAIFGDPEELFPDEEEVEEAFIKEVAEVPSEEDAPSRNWIKLERGKIAPAFWTLLTFTVKKHSPRSTMAMRPAISAGLSKPELHARGGSAMATSPVIPLSVRGGPNAAGAAT